MKKILIWSNDYGAIEENKISVMLDREYLVRG